MSLCVEPAVAALPPCPVPSQVWLQCRQIPAGHPAVLSLQVTQRELDIYLAQLRRRKQPGDDGVPNEILRGADTALSNPSLTADETQVTTDLPGALLECVNE
eukprot:1606473-Rhodomonas_salina.1